MINKGRDRLDKRRVYSSAYKNKIRKRRMKVKIYRMSCLLVIFILSIVGVVKMIENNFATSNYLNDGIENASELDGTSNSTVTSNKVRVVLDAGHGGHDVGANLNTTYEKDITLSVALKVGKILEKENIEVIYTRNKDVSLGKNEKEDLEKRVSISNKSNADYFISFHINSADIAANGFEVWSDFNSEKGFSLASEIEKGLDGLQYTQNRQMKDGGTSLLVIRETKMPAVLVELGFMNNSKDRNYLKNEENHNKLAKVIADAILIEVSNDN